MQNTLNKKTINKFGTHYLLGKGKDGQYYYLEKESRNCGWYWGFGYIHSYTNNRQPERSKDIAMHTHFDSLFLKTNIFYSFKEFFVETTLNDNEIWQLLDLMQSAYTLRKTAELFYIGGSHITSKAKMELLENQELYNKINKELLPAIFEKIKEILMEKVGE